ncbi:MAG: hypothetical protein JWO73_148 [Candidatus Taylorbacteria bacterium]|nr:hypothetical protein [Candidatus Taylorbacteria bacterium]
MNPQETAPQPQIQQQVPQGITIESAHAETNDFIHRVYGWMGIGLVVTSIIAYVIGNTPSLTNAILGNRLVFYALLIVELLVVIFLSRMVQRLSSTAAAVAFLVYAALNGLTISIIFLVYATSSIASVFAVTAIMFLVVAAYGFYTKRDLTTVGNLAFMALIGIIIASVVNLFFMNDHVSLVISYISVIVFVGLTAYDNQKIKAMNTVVAIGSEMEKKAAIMGALTLYLDFINLFLSLLRILGKRK